MGFGSEASSSTRTKVREIPRAACCRAVWLTNRLSGSLPQSNPSRSRDFASSSILRKHRAFDRLYRVLETLVGLGRIVEQGENLPGVFLREPDDGFTLDHALRFLIRRLHNELVDDRAQKLRRLFQRVSHAVRDTSRNPLARLFHYMFHACMVPLWHRLVNGVSARPLAG